MCYLFLHEFGELRDIDVSREGSEMLDEVTAPVIIDQEPAKVLGKRSPESGLESDLIKKAKHSDIQSDDTEVIVLQESDHATSEQGEDIEIKNLKLELRKEKQRTASLNTLVEKLRTENLIQIKANADLEVEKTHWKQRQADEVDRAKAYKVESLQRFQDRVRCDLQEQFDTKKVALQQKLDGKEQKIAAKIPGLKKKFNDELQLKKDRLEAEVHKNHELTDKNKTLEKELKRVKVDHTKALRDVKDEHEQVLKESRKEQREQIREWKPEHSTAIKEKDRLLKEQQKEIDSLTSVQQGLQHTTDQLDIYAKELQAKYDELKLLVTERDEKLKEAAKLLRSRERAWQAQNETANKYAQDLIQQQRVNSILRSGLDRSTQRAEDLEVELLAAKDQIKQSETGTPPLEIKQGEARSCVPAAEEVHQPAVTCSPIQEKDI